MPDRYLVERDHRTHTKTGRQTGGCWFPVSAHDTEHEAQAALGDAMIEETSGRALRLRKVWPSPRDAGGSEVLITFGG